MITKYTCCICGKEVSGWGNNPWPINNDPDKKCCEECNMTKVIPARIIQMKNKK